MSVAVRGSTRRVVLKVTDDGSGFDVSGVSAGLGLASMRQRAAAAGGTVQVDSAPGQGTTVRLEVPA